MEGEGVGKEREVGVAGGVVALVVFVRISRGVGGGGGGGEGIVVSGGCLDLDLGLGLRLRAVAAAADERLAEEGEARLRPCRAVFGDCGLGGEELVEQGCGWGVGGEGGAEGVGAGAEVGGACGWWGCHCGGGL